WKNDMPTQFPEIEILYYFAFLAGTLFYSDCGHDSSFPKTLTIQECVDDSGKQAFSIETDDKKIFENHPTELAKQRLLITEKRFREMEIDDKYTSLEIFNSEYQKMRTNESVCARLSEEKAKRYKLDESVYRALLRITRNNNLKVPLALDWASTNL